MIGVPKKEMFSVLIYMRVPHIILEPHFAALSSESSEKEWEKRKRTNTRTVTETSGQSSTPNLRCTVAMDDLDAIDFQDLIQLDQQPPAPIPVIPPVIKTPAQVVPAPVELSIHASPGSSSSGSSSSSTSDTEAEKLELLRAIARGTEETARVARLQVDVMMTLNQNILTHNTLVKELHALLKEMKTEKQPEKKNEKTRSRSRSRSPRRRTPQRRRDPSPRRHHHRNLH